MATATKASKNIYRLFVGNLPWTVSHQELKLYFKDFGRVVNANVIFDKKTGLTRGYGFVTLNSLKSLEKIESEQKHLLEAKVIDHQRTTIDMETQSDSDWEFDEDENDILFTKATQQVQRTHDKILPHDLLQLYGLFKQATIGKCNTPKPGIFNMQGRAKWCAWQDLTDMPSDFAKQRYIEKVREIDPEWYENIQQGNLTTSGAGNFGGPGWVVHSVEMPPDDLHNHKPDHEKTIFDFVKDRNVLMVKAKLKESDLYALDESGLGLIHWATDANDIEMLSLLLSSGCPVDLRDADQQQTALHYAASCGHSECVRSLLQYGADKMAQDVEDQTCIDVADDPAIRLILESSTISIV